MQSTTPLIEMLKYSDFLNAKVTLITEALNSQPFDQKAMDNAMNFGIKKGSKDSNKNYRKFIK